MLKYYFLIIFATSLPFDGTGNMQKISCTCFVCVGGGGGGGGGGRFYQADFRLTSEGSLMEHWPHFLEFPFHFLKIVVGMQAFSSHYSVVSIILELFLS